MLKKFRVYLLELSFRIVTDCDAFVKTMSKKDISARIARWVAFCKTLIIQLSIDQIEPCSTLMR